MASTLSNISIGSLKFISKSSMELAPEISAIQVTPFYCGGGVNKQWNRQISLVRYSLRALKNTIDRVNGKTLFLAKAVGGKVVHRFKDDLINISGRVNIKCQFPKFT